MLRGKGVTKEGVVELCFEGYMEIFREALLVCNFPFALAGQQRQVTPPRGQVLRGRAVLTPCA